MAPEPLNTSAPDALARFAETASTYDRARRQLIPCFDRFYGTALEALEAAPRPITRVLELGCGTGLLSAMVALQHPEADLVLTDGSPAMLDRARARLADHLAVTTAVLDMNDPLPEGPFDAVVSALAIHHLSHDDKRTLFGRIAAALAPGGLFVNAEQVLAPTTELDVAQNARWRRAARAAGVSDDDLAAADHRMASDICATVADQLAWLRDAGFIGIDCPFRDGRFAVMRGQKP